MKEPVAYVLLDLETTGLQPQTDQILEIAAIAVTRELEELGRFEVVLSSDKVYMPNVGDFVQRMHTVNGLWIAAEASPWEEDDGDRALRDWLISVGCAPKGVILMGNSVHFDHSFISARLPRSASFLSHRTQDIGGLARWMADFGFIVPKVPEMPHRAMGDCEIELAAARELRKICCAHIDVFDRTKTLLSALGFPS